LAPFRAGKTTPYSVYQAVQALEDDLASSNSEETKAVFVIAALGYSTGLMMDLVFLKEDQKKLPPTALREMEDDLRSNWATGYSPPYQEINKAARVLNISQQVSASGSLKGIQSEIHALIDSLAKSKGLAPPDIVIKVFD